MRAFSPKDIRVRVEIITIHGVKNPLIKKGIYLVSISTAAKEVEKSDETN